MFSNLEQWALCGELNNAKNSVKNIEKIINIKEIKTLLIAVADHSPYLCQLFEKFPEFLISVFEKGPDICLSELMEQTKIDGNVAKNTTELKKILRVSKSKLAIVTALADVGGLWSLDEVTLSLSKFADLSLQITVAHLLDQAMSKQILPWPDGFGQADLSPDIDNITKDKLLLLDNCGYIILALGKMGGNELNYSSDIDLIALFDDEKNPETWADKYKIADFFVKLTKDLIDIISKRTEDGYVFRTDFRLRPDPGATPLAISLNAAESYYQSIGQNWERSAMIKARGSAGEQNVANDFLERMKPFMWRRNLDFAAISDIHGIKSQLHTFHGHGKIALKGHDVKIGYGGIREIEFFAQIQQLIYGGRVPELRLGSTIPTLKALEKFGKITNEECTELSQAYVLLRNVEHRLQMINDEQTHKIPEQDQALEQLASFLNFASTADMEKTLTSTMHFVAKMFATLSSFDKAQKSGQELLGDDPSMFLTKCGFINTKDSSEVISRWRAGRYRGLRSQRARKLFEKCLPNLLRAFSQTSDPMSALARFDDFLSKLPAGVQLFSLFDSNPWLFKLIAKIMGSAPFLAQHLALHPALFDTLLDPQFFKTMPTKASLEKSLDINLAEVQDHQDFLQATRRWLNDRKFEVGVHILEGTANAQKAEETLGFLADIILSRLIPWVEKGFAEKYGTFENGHFLVIALGSYGSQRLTFTSDLDLVFLYDLCGDAENTSKLSPSQYYSRLGQQIITAISAHTGEGYLYNLDMRLRPSGHSGPMVVATKTFDNYQNNEAWVWEHMALTKARTIYGEKTIKTKVLKIISNVLLKEKDRAALRHDISEMHQKIEANLTTKNIWQLRNYQGGLADIDFILQYLILQHYKNNKSLQSEEIIRSSELTIFELNKLNILDNSQVETLLSALKIYHIINGILRLSYGENPDEKDFSKETRTHLATQCGKKSFAALKAELEQTSGLVYAIYKNFLD
jgi:glutamate-ammonia-ligase adenylyltransferase